MRVLIWLLGPCLLTLPLSVAAGPLAQFHMIFGDIDVELYDADKPVTVDNFIRYVTSGAYQDMFVHRWEPGSLLQGGGYVTLNRGTTNAALVKIHPFDAITNEYSVGKTYSNTYGTIAMARQSGMTNSATSQWYFNLRDNSNLDKVDGGFTVFGRVVGGTNVLDRFSPTTTDTGVYWLTQLSAPFNELPVLSRDVTLDTLFDDVPYVEITLLTVQITRAAGGGNEISWQSVSNRVNRVQFTAQLPPNWTDLISTNGTGQSIRIPDLTPSSSRRFYRVLVDY